MKTTTIAFASIAASLLVLSSCVQEQPKSASSGAVADSVITAQRVALANATANDGTGPQAPRDLASTAGTNPKVFPFAPAYTSMNLCNIHFHESAEHKGGQFTKYAGNGDGKGTGTGYEYSGTLTAAETTPIGKKIGEGKTGHLAPGDTIEVHYVHTTAPITPGPTLGSCLTEEVSDPFLRVETQVMVLVNDPNALDFVELARVENVGGLYRAPNIPTTSGTPIQYLGSTTGPKYNEQGSPFKVTWSVRPNVIKVNINSVDAWFSNNIFDEDHAHGVRNLVTNPALLSRI